MSAWPEIAYPSYIQFKAVMRGKDERRKQSLAEAHAGYAGRWAEDQRLKAEAAGEHGGPAAQVS